MKWPFTYIQGSPSRITYHRLLMLATTLIGFSIWAESIQADEASSQAKVSADTVVLLLSQTVHTPTSAVLSDRVMKLSEPRIGFKIVSSEPTPIIDDVLTRFQTIALQAATGLTFYSESDIAKARLVIVFDDKMSKTLTKYGLSVEDLLRADGINLDAEFVSTVTNLVMSDSSQCINLSSTYDDYTLVKSYLFISSASSDLLKRRCTFQLLLGALGMSSGAVPGDSIKAANTPIDTPTATDVLALRLLYSPEVQPGDTIGKILSNQHEIEFVPSP